jgi:hypothetical protein
MNAWALPSAPGAADATANATSGTAGQACKQAQLRVRLQPRAQISEHREKERGMSSAHHVQRLREGPKQLDYLAELGLCLLVAVMRSFQGHTFGNLCVEQVSV